VALDNVLDVSNLVRADGEAFSIDQYMETLWAVEESRFFAQYNMLMSMDLRQHIASGQARSGASVSQPDRTGIVRIDISGTMTKQGSSMSSAGSTVRIRQAVRQAKNDPDVEGVLFVLDTPGGAVSGTGDLAEDMRELSALKPTITLAEDLMASAGLWAGLQSRKVYANKPNAVIGSMGVFIGLYDLSGAAAQKGIKPVVIKTGELKGAGFQGAEITEAQKAMWQGLADGTLEEFKSAAQAMGRKFSAEQMTEILRAGVYPADKAIGLGLIDGIRSYDAAVAELRSMIPTKRKGMKMTELTTPQAATLGQLKAACDGAGSDFLMSMLEAESTAEVAQKAWAKKQNASILDLTSQLDASKVTITELNGKVTTLETAATKATTDHAAEVKQLNKDLVDARAGRRTGFAALPTDTKPPAGAGPVEGSATERWNAKIEASMKSGMTLQQATREAAGDEQLHSDYLDEANPNRKK
jgi:signal peptide peptidase SppA